MAPSSNVPSVVPAPSATVARRSSRLQTKKLELFDEPQVSERSTRVHITPVANKQPQNDDTASISEDSDAAARFVAVDCLLRFKYADADHLKYGSLPPPPASVGAISTSGVTTQQPDKARSEKENEAAPLSKKTTDATHVATNATTAVSSDRQPPTPKQTIVATTKRTRGGVLKRKANNDASELNGPALHTQRAETRSFKRPRSKFVVEPSERITRSLNAKVAVEVEGAGVDTVILQQNGSGVGSPEQATATTSTSTSTSNTIVNSNTEALARTTDSVVGPEALNGKLELQHLASTSTSAQPPRLTLVIPARARFAAVEGAATDVAPTSIIESVVTVTEPEGELKALKFAEKEPSADPKIRVSGGQRIEVAA